MSLPLIIFASLVLGCALIAVMAAARAEAGGRGLGDPHGLRRQLAGMLVGTALAGVAWLAGEQHEFVFASPPLGGSCWLVGLIVAERGRERLPLQSLRVAGLGPRTAGGFVSRYALAAMRGTFALAAGLAVLAMVLASDADAGSYAADCADGTRESHGPWPGAPYAVPALVALALGWALAERAVRCVARRPPAAGDAAVDAGRRTMAARAAVTASMLMTLPTVGALLVSMGAGIHGACPTAGESALSLFMLTTGGLLVLASAAGWVAALLSGGRSIVPRMVA